MGFDRVVEPCAASRMKIGTADEHPMATLGLRNIRGSRLAWDRGHGVEASVTAAPSAEMFSSESPLIEESDVDLNCRSINAAFLVGCNIWGDPIGALDKNSESCLHRCVPLSSARDQTHTYGRTTRFTVHTI